MGGHGQTPWSNWLTTIPLKIKIFLIFITLFIQKKAQFASKDVACSSEFRIIQNSNFIKNRYK